VAAQDPNRDRASAELLRRALASPDGAAEPCPDPEILAAYAERSLDASETAHYELHFAQCATCRDQLAAMARAAAPAPRPPRISWIWNWGWIALAPVTAVLLIAAVFIARQSREKTASLAHVQPLVAMSRDNQTATYARNAPFAAPPSSPQSAQSEPMLALPPRAAHTPPPERTSTPRNEPALAGGVATGAGFAPAPAPAPADDKKLDSSSGQLPLTARNYTDLSQPQNAPAAPAPKAEKLRASSETVTVESDAAGANTEAAAPGSLADNSRGRVAAAAPSALKSPANYSAIVSIGQVNQSVAVESAVDRPVRSLVQSPDPQVLWRISSGRYVERSTDAGATWHVQWTNATANVVAGSAPSADTCWLVGSGGIVLRTTDAMKWHTVTPPEAVDFTAVSASDARSATITTKDGRQFKTRDGGKHWTPAP